ncbi:MAG: MFS transporter [Acidimicrobiia bacterium]|nr:MFS transporter [Acidimicrobiia bacterium]
MPSRNTRVLTFGVFLTMTGIALVAPILPLYAREFGVSRTGAGVLVSSFAVARLIFDPIGGVAADRLGPRRIMTAGGIVVAVSSVLAALAPSYAILVVARVIEGFGSAAFATAAMHTIITRAPKERMGREIAFFQTGLLGGVAVGPFIGGRAAEIGDFATPFWIYAFMGVIVAYISWRFVEDAPPSGKSLGELWRSAGSTIRNPAFAGLLFVAFAMFVMRAGARVTLLPLFGAEELGLSESQIGDVLAISALVTVLIVNPGGWLVDRVGRRPVLVVGMALTAATVAAYGQMTSYGGLLGVSIVFGVVAGIAGIVPPTLAGDLAPEGAEGSAVGMYRMAGDLGLIVGPIWLGSVADTGDFTMGFNIAAGLLLAAAAVGLFMRDATRRTTVQLRRDA